MIIKKIFILIHGCLILNHVYPQQCPSSCIQPNLSLSCNNNIFCDPATLPQDVYDNNSRSVVKILNSDNEVGTGTLLRQAFSNGDDNQQQNIIIPARHVIHSGSLGLEPLTDLNQMKFYFNYSNPDCNNPRKCIVQKL
ncbi:MAG: hypothetical protein HYX39_11680 [Bacteroidetes bacterium]|nr:hypothetical protein [Bacteroidota bacterium]